MEILSILLSIIFTILSIIHFNWAIGGTYGFDIALPTTESGTRVLNPGRISCTIVGIGLSTFALLYLIKAGMIEINIPSIILKITGWVIPSIFLIRAIGDFNYVGFFKKLKNTTFGKMDSKLYSPLCFFISVIGIVINLI